MAGHFLKYCGWIYHSHPNFAAKPGLFKMRHDGTRDQQLSTDKATSINVVGDWIYYTADKAMYRIRTDGTERSLLNSIDAVTHLHVIGNTVYYVSNGSLFKMSVNGTNREKVSDETSIALMSVHTGSSRIFYTRQTADGSWRGIYSMGLTGGNKTTLTTDRIDDVTVATNADLIYYVKTGNEDLGKRELYSIIFTSGNKTRIGTDYYRYSIAHNQYVYFGIRWEGYRKEGVYRMRNDGQLSMLIDPQRMYPHYFWQNNVYRLGQNYVTRVSSDGTGKVQLK